MKKAIQVWCFEDAPTELRALSGNAGDEDWLAAIPPGWFKPNDEAVPNWMFSYTFCADSEPQIVECGDGGEWAGWTVVIGSHA